MDRTYSLIEVSKLIGVTPETIKNWEQARYIPQASRIGLKRKRVWGKTKVVGFPWMFSETPASWRREAPEFSQHTEEILMELGYTWDDIAKLKDEGVIT